ncbi:unnamed protein product [Allacma fusca]|uniref:Uncharacterized protein n=1 Tax=Allacma fusca TaxID=39272 RepID=A0A8J2KYP9_9HEXA|nr:unnamed protein product [Allacma fusca]
MMPRPNWVIPSISNNWIRYLELVLLLGLLPGDFYLQCQCYQQSANLQVTSNPTVFTNSAVSLPFTPVPWHNYTTIYGTDGIIGSENFYTEHPTQMNLSNRRSLRLSFPFGRYRNRAPRRRKPQFGYTHPYRRPHRLRRIIAPSKLQSWQKELRNRFNNHRRE